MFDPNSEKILSVEEIMANIREKIKREQDPKDYPSEEKSTEEVVTTNGAEQEAFWAEHKKNIEFHFWDQHLMPINKLWNDLANSDKTGPETFWSEYKKNLEFRFWNQYLQPINDLWKEVAKEEQPESEETKIVKFEFWDRFLTALNQKWQLNPIRDTLPSSPKPLIGRILDALRLRVYTWLDPIFTTQQNFNGLLVQWVNHLVERVGGIIQRITRLERNMALNGEAVKFYNDLAQFLAEETTQLERKLHKQRVLSGEAVKFYNEIVRFLTEETIRIDKKLDHETFQIRGKLAHVEGKLAHESRRIDELLSMSSYCAFMEHRQEIMEIQIKALQEKIQELEKRLTS
jgi:hypothetical protein